MASFLGDISSRSVLTLKGLADSPRIDLFYIIDDSDEHTITFAEITTTAPKDPLKYFDRYC
ncbi:hypothetical protein CIL05_17065 [Virgibacillus profundi]|uniref:Uncharacterized protein n=1 Tax=Virgibacillus profundi TaxID=2024555 RepID=A0A2A2IB24_9BACI|nr:hypothetical protein CIL05_17065 [Virgibacillus profundi]PXY52293.1 hypothetical protein CIT14_18710 [Virgibacillus profundi]